MGLALALAAAVFLAFAPRLPSDDSSRGPALSSGASRVTAGSRRRIRVFTVVQIAASFLLLASAGVLLTTLRSMQEARPGFETGHVLIANLPLISDGRTPQQVAQFYQEAQREVESLPGVRAASFGGNVPLTGFNIGQGFEIVGGPTQSESLPASAHYQIVGARYFETLGIPLQAGRAFTARDDRAAPQVAIVNQEFARKYLQGRDPVGAHVGVQAMDPGGPKYVDREIVGVSGQVKIDSLGESENPVEIYVPITQNPWFDATLAVRAEVAPQSLTAAVRAALSKIDKDIAPTDIRTMDEIASDSVARPRFRARLLSGFGALALVLSAVGVFAVLAFSVSQRRREFGIRMALGAQAPDVLTLVLTRGAKIAITGIALGLAGAAVLARSLATLLFGVQPGDPATFVMAAATLGAVALVAAAIPAWRAATIDPAIVLREE